MTASTRFDQLRQNVSSLKTDLVNHEIYGRIDGPEALQIFMQHHVFAVWDFMSLLKFLQQQLSCVSVPWLPAKSRLGARLVNEIVLAEESDEDAKGEFASHFELYYRAMQQVGADVSTVDDFITAVQDTNNVTDALAVSSAPLGVQRFVADTFEIIETGDVCAVAGAFLFGREDLLPDLFRRIIQELNDETDGRLDDFVYYLNRHIELDGDEHGPLAAQLLTELCGDDDAHWNAAETAARKSLEARAQLWDDVCAAFENRAVIL